MKKTLLLIGITGLIVFSCHFPFSDIFLIEETSKEISDFLKHKDLGKLSAVAIGGSIPVEDFFSKKITDTNEGVMMYYCLNTNPMLNYAGFFMATERMKYNMVNSTPKPIGSVLNGPTQIFLYLKNDKEPKNIEDYLLSTPTTSSLLPSPTLTKTDLKNFNDNFGNLIKDNSGIHFNKVNWAYFQNNKAKHGDAEGLLTRLVKPSNVKYINYYFGYNYKADSNAVRIILIGADKNRKNIPELMIQKSIPD